MARFKTIDEDTPLYPSQHGDHAVDHLRAGTEVGTIGQEVPGPHGHGPIVPVYVPLLGRDGWVYTSQLEYAANA